MMFDVVNENATRLRDALNVATEERDDALRRARVATQTIVAEIGADGPMSVEDAASKAVAAIVDARCGGAYGVDR